MCSQNARKLNFLFSNVKDHVHATKKYYFYSYSVTCFLSDHYTEICLFEVMPIPLRSFGSQQYDSKFAISVLYLKHLNHMIQPMMM